MEPVLPLPLVELLPELPLLFLLDFLLPFLPMVSLEPEVLDEP